MGELKPMSVKEEAGKSLDAGSSLEEEYLKAGLSPDDASFLANFSHERRTKCVRKVCSQLLFQRLSYIMRLTFDYTQIDFRLCPALMILYLCAYLDRANIG